MALLKSGSTVGGNLIWHQGILPLFPADNKLFYKNYKIYTENDKPNNSDVGLSNVTNDAQVKKAGDTMTGDLKINTAGTANLNIKDAVFRTNPDNHLIISVPEKTISIRPKGNHNLESEFVIDASGIVTVDTVVLRKEQSGRNDSLTRKDYVDGKVSALETATTNLANTKVAKSGDTMTGKLTAPSVWVSQGQDQAVYALTRKDYVDNLASTKVSRSGDTLTGELRWTTAKALGTYTQFIESPAVNDTTAKNYIRKFRNRSQGYLWHEVADENGLSYYTGTAPDQLRVQLGVSGVRIDGGASYEFNGSVSKAGIDAIVNQGSWSTWRTRPALIQMRSQTNNGSSTLFKILSNTGKPIAAFGGFSTTGEENQARFQFRFASNTIDYYNGGMSIDGEFNAKGQINVTDKAGGTMYAQMSCEQNEARWSVNDGSWKILKHPKTAGTVASQEWTNEFVRRSGNDTYLISGNKSHWATIINDGMFSVWNDSAKRRSFWVDVNGNANTLNAFRAPGIIAERGKELIKLGFNTTGSPFLSYYDANAKWTAYYFPSGQEGTVATKEWVDGAYVNIGRGGQQELHKYGAGGHSYSAWIENGKRQAYIGFGSAGTNEFTIASERGSAGTINLKAGNILANGNTIATQSWANSNFHNKSVTYTRAEMDNRYLQKANATSTMKHMRKIGTIKYVKWDSWGGTKGMVYDQDLNNKFLSFQGRVSNIFYTGQHAIMYAPAGAIEGIYNIVGSTLRVLNRNFSTPNNDLDVWEYY